MTVTLWIDTDREETLELGQTFACYQAFGEWTRAAGGWEQFQGDYPDLSGVLTQCELQEDADPDWLVDVGRQAKLFLARHGDKVGQDARNLLDNLSTLAPEP